MTAKAPARPSYVSGWCGTAQHERCAAQYAGTDCTCPCHLTVAPSYEHMAAQDYPLLLAEHQALRAAHHRLTAAYCRAACSRDGRRHDDECPRRQENPDR